MDYFSLMSWKPKFLYQKKMQIWSKITKQYYGLTMANILYQILYVVETKLEFWVLDTNVIPRKCREEPK